MASKKKKRRHARFLLRCSGWIPGFSALISLLVGGCAGSTNGTGQGLPCTVVLLALIACYHECDSYDGHAYNGECQ